METLSAQLLLIRGMRKLILQHAILLLTSQKVFEYSMKQQFSLLSLGVAKCSCFFYRRCIGGCLRIWHWWDSSVWIHFILLHCLHRIQNVKLSEDKIFVLELTQYFFVFFSSCEIKILSKRTKNVFSVWVSLLRIFIFKEIFIFNYAAKTSLYQMEEMNLLRDQRYRRSTETCPYACSTETVIGHVGGSYAWSGHGMCMFMR